jgi:hypothetical protein
MLARLRIPATTIAALARDRLEALKTRPVEELRALPDQASDVVQVCGVRVDVTIYRDAGRDRRVRVVSQASLYRLLGVYTVTAFGFDVDAAGAIHDLEPKDLWDYS